MLSKITPARAKIWCESFAALRRNVIVLWPWALGFALLSAVGNYLMIKDQLPMIKDMIHDIRIGIRPVAGKPSSAFFTKGQLINSFTQLASLYCYIVVYLKREPITIRPTFSLNGFFYWLGKLILKIIAVSFMTFAITLAVFIPGILLTLIVPESKLFVMIVIVIVAICAISYTSVKYWLVGPLAVSQIKPTLKTSWLLTQGSWWRLGWQVFVFGFMLILTMIIGLLLYALIVFGLLRSEIDSLTSILGLSMVIGVYSLLAAPAMGVFFCTAARILYEEKQVADPGFSLTSQT
jgi:hypothetical protein